MSSASSPPGKRRPAKPRATSTDARRSKPPRRGLEIREPPVAAGTDAGDDDMRAEYDFSNAQPNPFAATLKQSITIRLDDTALAYFKGLSDELGMPYQSLINFYLRECAQKKRRPKWL